MLENDVHFDNHTSIIRIVVNGAASVRIKLTRAVSLKSSDNSGQVFPTRESTDKRVKVMTDRFP